MSRDEILLQIIKEIGALRRRVAALEHQEWTGLSAGAITSAEIADGACLEEILDDDGAGSGLDADKLDGMEPTTSAAANTIAQRDGNADLAARVLRSTVATGTAPLAVSSSTTVANLSADKLDGMEPVTSATANTIAQRDGNADLTARILRSTVATGTAPLAVSSSTTVANLSADMVDGKHLSDLDSRYVNEGQANSITPDMLQANIPPTKLATPPACRVYRSTSQTIPSNTVTPLSFDTEVFDYGGCWSSANPTRLTAPASGLYMVGGGWAMQSVNVVGGKSIYIGVRASNGSIYGGTNLHTEAGLWAYVGVSTLVWINSGDHVELIAYHDMGTDKPTRAATSARQDFCHGWMVRVG